MLLICVCVCFNKTALSEEVKRMEGIYGCAHSFAHRQCQPLSCLVLTQVSYFIYFTLINKSYAVKHNAKNRAFTTYCGNLMTSMTETEMYKNAGN